MAVSIIRRRGRPAKANPGEIVYVNFPADLHRMAKLLAAIRGCTIATVYDSLFRPVLTEEYKLAVQKMHPEFILPADYHPSKGLAPCSHSFSPSPVSTPLNGNDATQLPTNALGL